MEQLDNDCLRQLDNHLAAGQQAWLFGAGISVNANIPLMYPLTDRVFDFASKPGYEETKTALQKVKGELPDNAHIEHILSHLGDLATIADRSKNKVAKIGALAIPLEKIREVHSQVLDWIAETVRWGYKKAKGGEPERIGTQTDSLVEVTEHTEFLAALLCRAQAGLVERRGAVRLFTTNYDTLLEDGLSLGRFSYWDGFSGGAVAYRSHGYGDSEPEWGFRAHVIKLHGSIDWHLDDGGGVWRVRDGDKYPKAPSRVLIYPQSTKYFATQCDPFAAQFELFRRTLCSAQENVLAICGYSFGDEHINQEIELALRRSNNKTTIVAFANTIGETLERWQHEAWSKRLYIVSPEGLHVGSNAPCFPAKEGSHDWWTFAGATKLLNNGAEACVV